MYTEIKLLIAGCTFVLSSAIMFLGALGILFVIISLSLNKRDNTEVDNRNDHQDLQKK